MTSHRFIRTELVAAGVATLTLNRPERANAIIPEMARELHEAVQAVTDDPQVGALVLTGTGKHFCPGMDGDHAIAMVEAIARGQPPQEPFDGNLRHLHAATLALHDCPKPVVAALNGSAAAGGLDLALACDYRIAVGSAMFAQSYVKLALPPLNGGAWLLPRVVGRSRAARMLLTGERIAAPAALTAGLVDEMAEPAELLERAVALATQMAQAPRSLVAFLKDELRDEARAAGTLANALARAYVAGVTAVASEPCRRAIEQLRR